MSCTYLPGWSEARQKTEAYITVKTRNSFYTKRSGIIARLGRKMMGEQNGICPTEEVFSLSSVDPGVIVPLGCCDTKPSDDVQKGIDCLGNEIDIETLGGQADSVLCRSRHRGSFALGVDSFKPEFYSYERRFPTMCVDAGMASPKEVKQTLRTLKQEGPKMVVNDLEYLLWDLVIARGTGNTSIAEDVVFGQDVGLSEGQFPYAPKSHLNHEFIKRIQEIVMADPDNRGKVITVEASSHQIERAIEEDQRAKGLTRECARRIEDPWRAESGIVYDGIRYIMKDMADYVGLIDYGDYCTFIRPREHVHQAGTDHGVVARPNYALTQGCQINCNGYTLDKFEVAHWYLEDAIMFVPFIARGNVPTNGKEAIKDHVYASPTSFKKYDIDNHAVDLPAEDCVNDRGQYQQWGMMTRFGLFHRPDKITHGAILMKPVSRCITLFDDCCPEEKKDCLPDTKEVKAADRGTPFETGCPTCDGSGGNAVETGEKLAALPEDCDKAERASDHEGEIILVGSQFQTSECGEENSELTAQICVERVNGSKGALSATVATSDGSAVDGTNYTATSVTVDFADGECGRKCVEVPILREPIPVGESKEFAICLTVGANDPVCGTVTIHGCKECGSDDGCLC